MSVGGGSTENKILAHSLNMLLGHSMKGDCVLYTRIRESGHKVKAPVMLSCICHLSLLPSEVDFYLKLDRERQIMRKLDSIYFIACSTVSAKEELNLSSIG
jgi:hypothetical protein